MDSNLSLQSMRIFLAVLDHRSVGLAARSLHMSQSGLSTALAKLRKELGDALFLTTAAGMLPTSRAMELAAPMRDAVNCIEHKILRRSVFDPSTEAREFLIALTDVGETLYMSRLLNAVSSIAPNVRFRSVSMPPLEMQRALSEGRVDFALGYFPDLLAREFVRRKIAQHTFSCICSSANTRIIDGFNLKKYCEARHVVIEAPSRTQGLLERYIKQRGIERRIVLTTPHVMGLAEIISNTDMLASIPNDLAQSLSGFKNLIRLDLPFRAPVFDSHLYWSKIVHDDPGVRWLRTTLFKTFAISK
ncbi:LysR family transcriptional regulator [Candidimonas nitroreducens]|nr:LysR family transcriptional regulator [Candidimonas nitroreducens]